MTRESDVATDAGARPANTVEEVAGQVLQSAAEVLTKPRARGWIHLVSAIVAVVAGASLISVSWPLAGLKAGLATFIYTGAVVGMFTVSAIYHRVTWKSAKARKGAVRSPSPAGIGGSVASFPSSPTWAERSQAR